MGEKVPRKEISELLYEARSRIEGLTENLPSLVDQAGISHSAKIPYKTLIFREALYWRTEELSRTAFDHFSSNNLAAAMTLTRAFIEGVAATWYLNENIHKVLVGGSLDNFDKKIMRLLSGSRDDTSDLDAINVLSFIDAVDKKVPGFRQNYERLCEYAHPNWSGVSFLFAENDYEQILTKLGKNTNGSNGAQRIGLSSMIGGLIAYEVSYKNISDNFSGFTKVCEEDLKS